MKTPSFKKIDIKRAMRISTIVIIIVSVAALVGVGLFIADTLGRISNPESATNVPVRIDGVDEKLLDRLLEAQAAKNSPEARIPDVTRNPFAAKPPPAPVPESAPETTTPPTQ